MTARTYYTCDICHTEAKKAIAENKDNWYILGETLEDHHICPKCREIVGHVLNMLNISWRLTEPVLGKGFGRIELK